jgi:uncharacterized membrane protein YsdA (DUF1294 family)
MQFLTPINIAYYMIAINFVAFAAFGIDKARAEGGKRRTSEKDLLFLAIVGGVLGAFAGRALFRHKTRKQPFSTHLNLIAVAQLGLLVFGLFVWLG